MDKQQQIPDTEDPQLHALFKAMADEHTKSLSDLMDESGSDTGDEPQRKISIEEWLHSPKSQRRQR